MHTYARARAGERSPETTLSARHALPIQRCNRQLLPMLRPMLFAAACLLAGTQHPDDLRALEPQTPAQSVRKDARNAGAAAGGGACAEDTCQPPVAAALSPAEALVAMMQEAEANVAVAQHSQQLGKVRNVFSLCCLSSFFGRPLCMRPRTPLCANAAPRVFACVRKLSVCPHL